MKAHEVKALREAKGCSMAEAKSHILNIKLKRRLWGPHNSESDAFRALQEVVVRLIDAQFQTL